jgi:hypothetical protein
MPASGISCKFATSLEETRARQRHKEKTMLNRRNFATALVAAVILPGAAFAQAQTPSAATIQRQLESAPRMRLNQNQRVTVGEFKRRPDLRRAAPSIDIQSINFEFASAEIAPSQYRKVQNIADALNGILRRDRRSRNAVPSRSSGFWCASSVCRPGRSKRLAMARNSCLFPRRTKTGAIAALPCAA